MPTQSNNNAGKSWKDKYLDSLDQQERQDKQFKTLLSLLNQATLRISMIADGMDKGLDKQLLGMRGLLQAKSVSAKELKTVVEALGGQVKRMDAIKTDRGRQVALAFTALVAQLQQLKPDSDNNKALKAFQKVAKARSADLPFQPLLLKEFSELQQRVLADNANAAPSQSWWQRLRGGSGESSAEPVQPESVAHEADGSAEPALGSGGSGVGSAAVSGSEQALSLSVAAADEVVPDLPRVGVDKSQSLEPGFSRINTAVCEILMELLQQIEPPPMAVANHEKAMQQIEQGLNWYELVAVLEQISIVIVSAFDRDQQAFESFLQQLNDRLSSAYDIISSSQRSQGDSEHAQKLLQASMRVQVAAMQSSVVNVNDLEQLKLEVSDRLDKVLSVMNKHQSGEQTREQDVSSQLDALVEQVKSMELQSQQAQQQIEEQRQRALRDVLTQLPNREAYNLHLEQEFERWRRYQRPLTLVMCDIDHFKAINDSYGHQAGDKVLRIIARSIASRLRKSDFIARIGGEEFVVLMPETNQQAAYTVIDTVREAIAQCPFHFQEQPVTITLSFGITEFSDDDDSDAVFARADKALYQAKSQGRNRVIVAP
ncbi:diguanylate cyclase [Dasania marina]|uniref:GGDEF domain-containing protein n=1 Tax=Dasania marina TaxID=471499 RepID=UPI0030D90D29